MYVMDGGTASNTTADVRSYIFVQPEGKAYTTTVNSEGLFILDGFEDSTSINSVGSMYVSNGGMANGITVNHGGMLEVRDNGSAVQITENGGCVAIWDDKNVSFVPNSFTGAVLTTYATVHSGTTVTETVLNARLGAFTTCTCLLRCCMIATTGAGWKRRRYSACSANAGRSSFDPT